MATYSMTKKVGEGGAGDGNERSYNWVFGRIWWVQSWFQKIAFADSNWLQDLGTSIKVIDIY